MRNDQTFSHIKRERRKKRPRWTWFSEKSFSHTYDSTNGVHTLSFERSFEKGMFNSSIIRLVVTTNIQK